MFEANREQTGDVIVPATPATCFLKNFMPRLVLLLGAAVWSKQRELESPERRSRIRAWRAPDLHRPSGKSSAQGRDAQEIRHDVRNRLPHPIGQKGCGPVTHSQG